MEYDPAQRDAFYRSLLGHPGERGEVDYKASVRLGKKDSFSLKLFRHILGMANSGGGWIVIGYKEDDKGGLIPDPNHINEVCQSYDTTRLAKAVKSIVRGSDVLRVYVNQVPHEGTGLRYPIIRVEGFTKRPFFCKATRRASDTGDEILKDGCLYVRRPGGETVCMSDPGDWEELIERCLRMRRDDFLREFEDLLGRMGLTISAAAREPVSPSAWLEETRRRALGV